MRLRVRGVSLVVTPNRLAAMFETIDTEIEKTEGGPPTVRSRLVRLAGIVAVLIVFAAAMYYAIVTFE